MSLIIPIRGSLVDRCHPLVRDLILFYALNEGTGKSLFNHGSKNILVTGWGSNPTWEPGTTRLDGCLYAPGGLRIDLSGTGWWHTDEKLSFLVWLKLSETASDDWVTTTVGYQGFGLRISGSDFRIRYSGWGNNVSGITVGEWLQLVATSNTVRHQYYLNGVQVLDQAQPTMAYDPAQGQKIGHNSFGTAGFRGSIAQIGAWQRCLSAAEVALLYRDPWAMFPKPRPMAIRQRQYARVLK